MNAMKLLPLMRLLQRCRRVGLWRRAGRAPAAKATAACAEVSTAQEPQAPRGCGWFDSSYELQRGLRVQEDLSVDSLARELPLGAWLDLQLGGWCTPNSALEQPAFTHAR